MVNASIECIAVNQDQKHFNNMCLSESINSESPKY